MAKTEHVDAVFTATASFIAFLAMMAAMWSFTRLHLAWGAYNLVIAAAALGVVVAVRARAGRN